jgi:hypothetical protein
MHMAPLAIRMSWSEGQAVRYELPLVPWAPVVRDIAASDNCKTRASGLACSAVDSIFRAVFGRESDR